MSLEAILVQFLLLYMLAVRPRPSNSNLPVPRFLPPEDGHSSGIYCTGVLLGLMLAVIIQEYYWDPRWLLLVSRGLRVSSFSAGLVCASLSVAFAAYTFTGPSSKMQSAEKLRQIVVITVRHVGMYLCVCVCVCTHTHVPHTPSQQIMAGWAVSSLPLVCRAPPSSIGWFEFFYFHERKGSFKNSPLLVTPEVSCVLQLRKAWLLQTLISQSLALHLLQAQFRIKVLIPQDMWKSVFRNII